MLRLKLFILVLFTTQTVWASETLDKWIQVQRPLSLKKIYNNTSLLEGAPGAMIASPSKSAPNYFFHWVRDAGMITSAVLQEHTLLTDRPVDPLDSFYFDLIEFNRRIQKASNPSGNLGEPRFNINGTATVEPWPRPQNDGPALRVLSFIRLAKIWLSQGKEDWVRNYLYNWQANCVLKPDLEFISHNWQKTSFDLWEEIRGHHFFTGISQYKALKEGGELALALGDNEAGGWYLKQASHLESLLNQHWSAQKKYFLSTINQDGGITYKKTNLDTSVLLGILQTPKANGAFSVSDDRVVSTVHEIVETFKTLYPINQTQTEAYAIGRYPEDQYDGIQSTEGNPWYITTAAIGEYYYLLAKAWEWRGTIEITPLNLPFLRSLEIPELDAGQTHYSNHHLFSKILNKMRAKGDAYVALIRKYVPKDGSMTEQFNRKTGAPQGAVDLTWSYASLLALLQSRDL